MSEYEAIIKLFSENENIEIYKIDEKDGCKIIMSKQKYEYKGNYFYEEPIYQLFDKAGKRVAVNKNYDSVKTWFDRLVKENN